MRYVDFVKKLDELSAARQAIHDKDINPIWKQEELLEATLKRQYTFGGMIIEITFRRDYSIYFPQHVLGLNDLLKRPPDELRMLADIVEVLNDYKSGKIDDLPMSGDWMEVSWDFFTSYCRKADLPQARLLRMRK